MNLRFKAPLMVATAAGVVFVCTGYACVRAQGEYIESMRREKLTAVATGVKSGLEGQCRGASSQADFLANLGSVKDAMRSGDREALEAAVGPVFKLMTGKGTAEQAFFHDRDLKVLLNLREPARFGEDMSGRDMVVRANRYRETQAGVQVTATGLAVRAVASIDSGTEHLGSFEWGVQLGRFMTRIKETTGTELSVYVEERAIAAAGSGSRGGAEGEGSGLKTVTSTNADLVKSVVTNDLLQSVTEDLYSSRTVLGVEYDIVALPLFDFAGRQIGVVAGVKSMAESRREVTAMFTTFIVGTLVGVVVLAIVVFFVFEHLLRRPLAGLERSLEVFVKAEDFDTPVMHLGRPDEFGAASKSLNKLREKLVNDARLAKEAETVVTTRRLRKMDKDLTIEDPKS